MKQAIMSLDARYTIEQTRSKDCYVAMFESKIIGIATRKDDAKRAAVEFANNNEEN